LTFKTIRTDTKRGSGKYGRARARRRRWLVLLVLLVVLVAALPFVVLAMEAALEKTRVGVRQATHPLEYGGVIRSASEAQGLEPAFVAAVVRTESRFQPDVVSPQGAYGLMQIVPETAGFIQERSGITGDYRDPRTNVRMGTWYLAYLLGRYEGDERLALAAYNSGQGRVDRWLAEGRDVGGGDIPFVETRNYVESVLDSREVYRELYGSNLDESPQGLLGGG
jgi:soluble lytic murein transglycosylase